jgi:Sulfotransferase domain
MSEVLGNPGGIGPWMDAADGRPDWDAVFRGYRSSVDFPACAFYRELAAAYPEAKVVLTMRDAGSWFESVNETIMNPKVNAHLAKSPFGEMVGRIVLARFDHRVDDREHMVECFERHVEEVKESIPADRLLVYEVKEGWGPLCEFLGMDAPTEPFPRVNTRDETRALLEQVMAASQMDSAAKAGEVAGGMFGPRR